MGVIAQPRGLLQHLRFVSAAQVDGVTDRRNLQARVLLEAGHCVHVEHEVAERIHGGCLYQIGLGVKLYQVGDIGIVGAVAGEHGDRGDE